jgi:hypothetical protein
MMLATEKESLASHLKSKKAIPISFWNTALVDPSSNFLKRRIPLR